MKKLSCLTIVFFVLMSLTFQTPGEAMTEGAKSALLKGQDCLNRLFGAKEKGEITQSEFILQLGYLLFDHTKLDTRFQGEPGMAIKCGTPYIRELRENLHLLSQDQQEYFNTKLARPTCQQVFYTTHFAIHYDMTGTHQIYEYNVDNDPADGVPDFINRAAESAEFVYTNETTGGGSIGLDYDEPPWDGTEGGGTNLYDLYFQALEAGLYGYCSYAGNGEPGLPYDRTNDAKSYIVMHKTFWFYGSNRVEALKITTAHEYHHAVQFAYNVQAETALMEMCAVYMEDMIYDEIDDYIGWINPRFKSPHLRLKEFDSFSGIHYATMIWPLFLHEYYSYSVVRKIWEEVVTQQNTIIAMENAILAETGVTLQDAYQIYTEWFYLSGDQDDGQHYEEGASWVDGINVGGTDHVKIAMKHETFPAYGGPPADKPDRLGCNFIDFITEDKAGYGLEITLDGDGAPQIEWGATIIRKNKYTGANTSSYHVADSSGHIDISVTDLNQEYSKITLAVQNLRPYGGGGYDYWYQAHVINQPPFVPVFSTLGWIIVLCLFTLAFVGLQFRAKSKRAPVVIEQD